MTEEKRSYKIDNIIERSEKTQEILTYIPHWIIRTGIMIIGAIIIGFIVLSKFIAYPNTINSQITIINNNPPVIFSSNSDNTKCEFLIPDDSIVVSGVKVAVLNEIDTIKAEISGKFKWNISAVKDRTFGKGEVVFNIIPSETGNYFGLIKLHSNYSPKIKTGQKVHISLFEINNGMYTGKISKIDMIQGNDQNTLLVYLDLENKLSSNKELTHGMKGLSDIITEDITVFNRIFDKIIR